MTPPELAHDSRGPRIWRCDACGIRAPWGPGWRWLGRYLIRGRGAFASEEEQIERVLCPACPNDRDAPTLA